MVLRTRACTSFPKTVGCCGSPEQRPDPAADDERRCYYRLTGFGGEVLAAEVERLEGLVRAARRKGVFPTPKPLPVGS